MRKRKWKFGENFNWKRRATISEMYSSCRIQETWPRLVVDRVSGASYLMAEPHRGISSPPAATLSVALREGCGSAACSCQASQKQHGLLRDRWIIHLWFIGHPATSEKPRQRLQTAGGEVHWGVWIRTWRIGWWRGENVCVAKLDWEG